MNNHQSQQNSTSSSITKKRSHIWEGYALYVFDWYDEIKGFGIANLVFDLSSDTNANKSIFVHSNNFHGPKGTEISETDPIVVETIDIIRGKAQASFWHKLDGSEESGKLLELILINNRWTLAQRFLKSMDCETDFSSFESIFSGYVNPDCFITKSNRNGIDFFEVQQIIQNREEKRRNTSIANLIANLTDPYVKRLSPERRKELLLSKEILSQQIPFEELLELGRDPKINLSFFKTNVTALESVVRFRAESLVSGHNVDAIINFLCQYHDLGYQISSCQDIIFQLAKENLAEGLVFKYIPSNKQAAESASSIESLYREIHSYSITKTNFSQIVSDGVKCILSKQLLPLEAQVAAYSYGFSDCDRIEDTSDFDTFSLGTCSRIIHSSRPFSNESLSRIVNTLIDRTKCDEALQLVDSLDGGEKRCALSRITTLINDDFHLQWFLKISSYYPSFDEKEKRLVFDIANHGYLNFIETTINDSEELGREDEIGSICYINRNVPDVFGEEFSAKIENTISRLISSKSINVYIDGCINGVVSFHGWEHIEDFSSLTFRQAERACEMICKEPDEQKHFISLLMEKSNPELALLFSNKYHFDDLIQKSDEASFKVLSDKAYAELWLKGEGHIFNPSKIASFLDERPLEKSPYFNIDPFEDRLNRVMYKEGEKGLRQVVLAYLGNNILKDRESLQKFIRVYKYSQKKGIDGLCTAPDEIHVAFEWLFGGNEQFEYCSFIRLIPFLTIEQQRTAVKKYFKTYKQSGRVLELASLNAAFTPTDGTLSVVTRGANEELFDLSTRVVLSALLKFKETGKFLAGTELFNIFWEHKDFAPKAQYKLTGYFDECSGRCYIKNYNNIFESSIGTIHETERTFDIVFKQSTTWDTISVVKDSIKSIYGARYNGSYWSVPSGQRENVLNLAKRFRFRIELINGNIDKDNRHLRLYGRRDPLHKFCSGRYSQTQGDENLLWCDGAYCNQTSITVHSEADWEQYTMYDFCHILGYDLTERTKYYEAKDGLYMQFVGTVNWLNRAISHFYCRSCGDFLKPIKSSEYARHSVVKYSCQDSRCSCYNIPVYINTCLNNDCRNIIDSRESQKCPNGLFICKECGQCCSHDAFVRRRNVLISNGGFIPQDLIEKIDNYLGHREKDMYFCYKCGTKMEPEGNMFTCPKCGHELTVRKLYSLQRE